jgi:uncharacterized membrane protein
MNTKHKKGDTAVPAPGKIIRIFLVGFVLVLLVFWMLNAPPGLLGKMDGVGYAVCHRISSHSFYFADRPFSLCARCTGQYLGFFWGFWVHLFLGKKRTGFPSGWILVVLGLAFVFYFIDGVNSFLHLYPGFEFLSLYEPNNSLRLFSGLGMGMVISVFIYPLLGQTIWSQQDLKPTISGPQDWSILLGGEVVLGSLILTGNPLLLYPMIICSIAGLILLLSILYGIIWILVTKKENSFLSWSDLSWWGLAGFGTALAQILVIDLIRFTLTGTWGGFVDY